MGFMFLLVLAGLLGFVIAFAIGSVSFRLTGVYFALITLGFAELGRIFIGNWDHVGSSPRTGIALVSPDGFAIGIPFVEALQLEVGRLVGDTVTYDPLVIELSATDVSYYAIGAVVLVCYFVMQRIIHSPFGDVMMAIRDNEERANAVGYNTYWYKMVTFGISGFFAAVAGGLFAAYRRSVTPDNSMGLFVTADALVASLLGGVGTLAGAFYGYVFHGVLEGILTTGQDGLGVYLSQTLPDSLLSADVFGLSLQWVISNAIIGRAQLYLGIVFILFVLYVPGGFLGRVRARVGGKISEWSRMKTRRFWGR
jgi:branched-chain amino acid transport system permease protein